jgi:hypothetical protein
MADVIDQRLKVKAVRLGVSPLSWVNEVLEDLGQDTTAEAILFG